MLSIHLHLCKRRLRWLGNVRRMKDGPIPKDILYGELEEVKRKVVCPKFRFKTVIKRDFKHTEIDFNSREDEAEDHAN